MAEKEKGLSPNPKLATQKTPWPRTGYPGNALFRDSKNKWSNDVANVGAGLQRVFDDERLIDYSARWGSPSMGHIEERAFAHMWDYQNNGCSGRGPYGLLWMLLDDETRALIKDEEDLLLMQRVAATFAQWLGTNVGRGFVEEARRLATQEAKRLEPHIAKQKKLLQAIGELPVYDHEIAREKGVKCT